VAARRLRGTGSGTPLPRAEAGPAAARAAAQLEIAVAGDRRLAEAVILRVQELARDHGLEVPEATVVSRSARPKTSRSASRHRSAPRRPPSSSPS
jgi:hypothetical protein